MLVDHALLHAVHWFSGSYSSLVFKFSFTSLVYAAVTGSVTWVHEGHWLYAVDCFTGSHACTVLEFTTWLKLFQLFVHLA